MVKFLAARIGRGLVPVDDDDVLTRIGEGEIVTVDMKHPRNAKRLRYYWALMKLVHDNIENELHPTVEDLSDAVKVMVGHRKRFWIPPGVTLEDGSTTGPTGIFGYAPKSIAFGNMEEADFGRFVDRVVDLIVKWFLPGLSRQTVYKRVAEMTGLRPWWEEEAAR